MIVKVRRFETLARFRRYVRYCIAPKATGFSPERLAHYESESVVLPPAFDPGEPRACTAAAKFIADQYWDWVKANKPGRPFPKYPIIAPIVTFHPDDHRKLTPALQAEIIRKLIARVMPGDRQVFLPIHGDTDHGHGHPCVGAVDANGKTWNPRFDYRLWELACEDLELEYGLTRVRQRKACAKADRSREIVRASPRSSELQSAARTHMAPARLRLQAQVAGILTDSPGFAAFSERLAAQQIRVVPNVATTGRVSGLTFFDSDGAAHKGSSLGKGFAFAAIARITAYEPDRHRPIISRWLDQRPDRHPHSANGGASPRAVGDQGRGLGASPSAYWRRGASDDAEPSAFSRERPVERGPVLGCAASATAAGGLGAAPQPAGSLGDGPGGAVGGPQGAPQAARFELIAKRWANLARRSVSRLFETLTLVAQLVGVRLRSDSHRPAHGPGGRPRIKPSDIEPGTIEPPKFQL
jgi:hypothetical protein